MKPAKEPMQLDCPTRTLDQVLYFELTCPPNHASPTCFWCGRPPHAARRDCPAANDTCHRCGKRGHWRQVCRASAANTVYQADTGFHSSTTYFITHDIVQVQSAPKGIFVDLDLSTTPSPATTRHIRFQVDSGCSCNTIHVTDLQKMSPVKVEPSSVRLLDYSKSIIPTGGQKYIYVFLSKEAVYVVSLLIGMIYDDFFLTLKIDYTFHYFIF